MNPAPDLVVDARPGWTDELKSLLPGAHVAVLADDAIVGIEGRLAGLDLRDTILVLRAGPRTGFVFLFRKPLTESTVAEQVIATGTGGINIDACRGSSEGNTTAERTPGERSRKYWRTGVILGKSVPSTLGRWPPNFVMVHGACDASACSRTCVVPGVKAAGAERYYPQMWDEEALVEWLLGLVHSAGEDRSD